MKMQTRVRISGWLVLLTAVCAVGWVSGTPTRTSSDAGRGDKRAHEMSSNGTKRHQKHEMVEVVIPADNELETVVVSEDVEEELGHVKLGKNSTRKRRERHEKKEIIAGKEDVNSLKGMNEELIKEVENELDDPSLVVTEDSGTDFSTEIIEPDGSVVDEEIHTHHLRKVFPNEDSKSKSWDERVLDEGEELLGGESDKEVQNTLKAGHDSSSDVNSLLSKNVMDKMIRLRDLLNEAIEQFYDLEAGNELEGSGGGESSDSSRHMNLIRDALKEVSQDKRFILRKKREGEKADESPIQTCIYVDIPGEHPDTEVEPYFLDTENYETENGITQHNETIDYQTQDKMEYNSANQDDETHNMNPIYWLHIPLEENVPNQKMFRELVDVVEKFHKAGKDLLFVPVKKTYAELETESFLKGLQVQDLEGTNGSSTRSN